MLGYEVKLLGRRFVVLEALEDFLISDFFV